MSNTNNLDGVAHAYLVKGFWRFVRQKSVNLDAIKEVAGGESGLMDALIHGLAWLDDELWATAKADNDGYDYGVWYYDISEPFGEALAQFCQTHARIPAEDEARALLKAIYDQAIKEPT